MMRSSGGADGPAAGSLEEAVHEGYDFARIFV